MKGLKQYRMILKNQLNLLTRLVQLTVSRQELRQNHYLAFVLLYGSTVKIYLQLLSVMNKSLMKLSMQFA